MKHFIFALMGVVALSIMAFATTTLREQDLPVPFKVQGLSIYGAKSNAQIAALTCAGGSGACLVSSINEGDLYISTGALTGQFRNARTGKGP